MSDETTLSSCPFCSGEAFVRIDTSLCLTQSRYRVGCDKDPSCHGWYGHSRYYATVAEAIAAWNTRAELGSDIKPCPWCGRDMDKRSEADKDNAGHTWYRDDSDYIQCLIRSNEFMKKERVTHGTLTAEQVEKIVDRNCEWYEGGEIDAQAIVDELNAVLGSGTCKMHDCDGSFSAVNRPVWRCDCGAFTTQYTDATTYHKPRFCPNCGRRVER